MFRFLPRNFIFVVFLTLAALSTTLLGGAVASAHTPGDTSTDQAVLRDSPAVVRIISALQGGLVCHACLSDGSDIVSPQNGAFQWASSGSGAFISPDGYILTADHVVDHGTNNQADVDIVLQAAAQDIGQRYGLDPNSVLSFLENHPNQVQVIIQVVSQTVFLSTAYTGQLQNTAQVISYPITRIVVNSPIDKQDTAIIKVGAQDMPNLTLADASQVSVGETITAVAYPGDADQVTGNGGSGTGDFTPLLNPSQSDAGTISSLLTSTVETGRLTAQKTVGGTLYYETDAIANHGSSGGPVIDDQGRIIGFVDQGSDTGRVVSLVSSSVAEEYVRQAGVNNSGQGAFETLWMKAVNEYDASGTCHFTNSASDLNKLRQNYPSFGGIQPLLRNAQAKATPSDCPPPTNYALIFGAAGGGLVVVLLLTLVVVLLLKRRASAQPAVVPAAAMPWYNGSQAATVLPGMPAQASTPQPGLAYPSAPQPYQATQATGVYGNGYGYPVESTQMAPLAHAQQPGIGYPSGPSTYQQVQAPAASQCANGHPVQEPGAQFCPTCGAPVYHAAYHS